MERDSGGYIKANFGGSLVYFFLNVGVRFVDCFIVFCIDSLSFENVFWVLFFLVLFSIEYLIFFVFSLGCVYIFLKRRGGCGRFKRC